MPDTMRELITHSFKESHGWLVQVAKGIHNHVAVPILLLVAVCLFTEPLCAQQEPEALKYSIPAPLTGALRSEGQFGNSVAVNSAYTVVGAPPSAISGYKGVVRVFDTNTGALLHVIPTPSTDSLGFFGCSVAISGTRLVVGDWGDNTGNAGAGSAYVYDLSSETPTQPVTTFNNPTPGYYDKFGYSVAISGTRVLVGALEDDTSATDAGSVYVYDLSSATPTTPVAALNNPLLTPSIRFGRSVAISGDRIVAGAHDGIDPGGADAGSAYVYDLTSQTPTVPVATLRPAINVPGDSFGNSVAISGTRVVVGARLDETSGGYTGRVYVFDLSSATPAIPVVKFKNPTPEENDGFGNTVAISGTKVVVSDPLDDATVPDAGSAYVYELSSATPTIPVATLNNPNQLLTRQFGYSVAISGTRVAVGSPVFENQHGIAYGYDLTSATPTIPTTTLRHIDQTSAGDNFGRSVAISGTKVVVGAPFDDTVGPDAGSVSVYDLSSSTPTVPVVALNNPYPPASDNFGYSVAISGTRLVVGAPEDDTGATDAGRVYVYDLSSGTPTVPVAILNNPEPTTNDQFGWSVAITGARLAVGAFEHDSGATDAGSVYVYDLSSATPTVPVATLNNPAPSPEAHFGYSVAISGTQVVVGAALDDTGASNTGRAYVYDLSNGTPTVPAATLNNPSPAGDDGFGWSVAISGTRVVVGSVGHDSGTYDAGRAYVYDLSSGTPTVPVAVLDNPHPTEYGNFGVSVAISGTRLVVGAKGDDTGAAYAGSAYVYDLSSGTPTVPVATLNNPSPAASDHFAYSVAIDGVTAAIGAPYDDAGALDKGYAYVFTASPPVLTLGNNTNITGTGATLTGTVNPKGGPTSAQFEYGLTTDYGSTASVTLSPNDGTTPQNVSANLTGLTPDTTFHYRLTATNTEGVTTTSDGTFTTHSNNARLASLQLSSGTLSPAFASATTTYAVTVANTTATMTLTPIVANSNATVQINGMPVASGSASELINLTVGDNVITILVTAQDGVTTKTYTVTVKRTVPDKTKPAVTIDLAKEVTEPFTIGGTVKELVGLASLTVRLNGVELPLDTPLATDAGTTIAWSVSNVTPENGSNTIVIEALDYNGNLATVTKSVTYVNPALAGRAGLYSAVLVPSGAPELNKTGLVTLKVTPTGAFTGNLLHSGVKTAFSGTLRSDGTARFKPAMQTAIDLKTRGKASVTIGTLNLSVTDGGGLGGALFTQADAGTELAEFAGKVAPYGKKNPVPANPFLNVPAGSASTKGVYHAAFLPPPLSPSLPPHPNGAGFATVTITKTGRVKAAGNLADGTKFSASNWLRSDGSTPLFAVLYGKKGGLSGELLFQDAENTDVSGPGFLWLHPVQATARYYPDGWPSGLVLPVIGTKYAAPASLDFGQGAPDLMNGNARLAFSRDFESQPVFAPVSINPGSASAGQVKLIPAPTVYKLSLSPASGLFSGSFRDIDGTSVPYRGLLLNKGEARGGYGYFLRPSGDHIEGGDVFLDPEGP